MFAAMACAVALAFVPTASYAASASTTYEQAVERGTNTERAKAGLPGVTPTSCVNSFAESWAKSMASKKKLVHQDLGPIMKKCNLSSVAENIAYGYGSGSSVVAAWMKSPGHKKNILGSSYRQIGVGAVQDSRGVWWVSQVFGRAK